MEEHYVTVLDHMQGRTYIYKYTDNDLKDYEMDVETWLTVKKNHSSGNIHFMCTDDLKLEIY